jgi:hypothetical protein
MSILSGIPWKALLRLSPQLLRSLQNVAGGETAGLATRIGILEQEMATVMRTLSVLSVCVVVLFILSAAFLTIGILLLLRNTPAT